jgi:regulator of protease activity HflC (stomatin/prohibitin superfamily)
VPVQLALSASLRPPGAALIAGVAAFSLAFGTLVAELFFSMHAGRGRAWASLANVLRAALLSALVIAICAVLLAYAGVSSLWPVYALSALSAAIALEFALRAVFSWFAPPHTRSGDASVPDSLVASLLRLRPSPLARFSAQMRNRYGIDLRQNWVLQSVARLLPAAIGTIAVCAWLLTGVVMLGPEQRAVYERFGAFVRTQDAGLLVAWPQPFETVLLIPGSARVLEQRISALDRDARASAVDPAAATDSSQPQPLPLGDASSWGFQSDGAAPDNAGPTLSDALAGSGYVLIGDNGGVQLSATLYYRVVDPYAYVLQKDRLDSALQRVVAAAVVEVTASRDLDAILVARPELLLTDQQMALKREQLRGDMAQAVQRHLNALAAAHAGLGIEVARMDVQAQFPAAAVDAFNSVLTSLQTADRNIADARTQAETIRQGAQQSADQVLQNAQATATGRVATAQAETTTILQLETPLDANSDPGLLARAYRDRIQQILSKAGRVTTIDPHDASSLVLQGKIQ